MITKRFEQITLDSIACVEVLDEMVAVETGVEALKEIISIASNLTARWVRVWTLAERHLEVIEVIERIAQGKGKGTS